MKKIQMQTPLVEMDGDEMTRILWKIIKDELLLPYIDLNTEYYDLGLEYRNETDDQVTVDAAEATKKYGVAVKCATITPNKARMEEYTLKKMYKSPNGTIRAILDGTVFRAPIVVKGIEPCVKNWKKPITIARHAYGDVYKNTEMYIDGPGDAYLVFEGADGQQRKELIHHYEGPGVLQGMHNLDDSITSFARCCFNYALDTKQNLWLGGKDTISKIYDGRFKEIFATIYEDEFKEKFEEIKVEFDNVFKELFGGGKGTIELTEADDILDAGINIISQPPGKKLQNMMQLSGGEKALTAISLLFAIQNLKPSPFCLLDEIEAALDGSNVVRFAEYLHKLTKNTQFIVITHRRGTMNCADRLYGITMQEKGISALVSVDLLENSLTK